jgi:hypothetical protein
VPTRQELGKAIAAATPVYLPPPDPELRQLRLWMQRPPFSRPILRRLYGLVCLSPAMWRLLSPRGPASEVIVASEAEMVARPATIANATVEPVWQALLDVSVWRSRRWWWLAASLVVKRLNT